VRPTGFFIQLALVVLLIMPAGKTVALNPPALVWMANSSVKLEQNIGDVDWATGSNTTSRTVSRFNILGNDLGCSFVAGTNLLFFFGDTIGSNVDYHAEDMFAWSTTTNGTQGLLLNFFTNSAGSNLFVNPSGISLGADDTPNAGLSISNVIYLVCNTGADTAITNNPHTNDYSVLVTFNQTNLTFQTNRTISVVTNGGLFIFDALHLFGTNVVMFGAGKYRASDVYLAMTPAATFLSGAGTLYFTGLTNGQPTWSAIETNAVPVVQDNPTNGPAWPNDSPSVGNVSVIYSAPLGLWLMTYDGGRSANSAQLHTTGIYFSSAPAPWGPWITPQLIFNSVRDGGLGVFIYDAGNHTGPAGPTINPSSNNPTNTPGGVYAPYLLEPFTTISNGMLYIYYVMSTWNPYTNVKMVSAFTIQPVIGSPVHTKTNFTFSWLAPTNEIYQVDFSTNLVGSWNTLTNSVTSSNGTFNFTDNRTNSGGFGKNRFYRLRTSP
jgi:hypothetical protein